MEVAPIKTKRDNRRALKEIDGLMDAKRGTAEGDRLDVLVTLVEAWEAAHYPLDLPDPVEAIKYHMEHRGLAPKDLIPYIGSRNRVPVSRPQTEQALQAVRDLIPSPPLTKPQPVVA